MTLVVDASVACKWFVEERDSAKAVNLFDAGEALIAPDLIVPEVCNALGRKLRLGQATPEQCHVAIDSLPGCLDDFVVSVPLARRAFEIAETLDHAVYDCFYVALGEDRQATMLTADARFIRRLRATPWIETVALLGA